MKVKFLLILSILCSAQISHAASKYMTHRAEYKSKKPNPPVRNIPGGRICIRYIYKCYFTVSLTEA